MSCTLEALEAFVARGRRMQAETEVILENYRRKRMPDKKPDEVPQVVWHDLPSNCPRCARPIKVRGTPKFTRILEMLCGRCGWTMDVEALRILARNVSVPPEQEKVEENAE